MTVTTTVAPVPASRFPQAPAHLSPERADSWTTIVRQYDLDPPALELLRLALEALDRCEQARLELERHGLFTTDRYGGRKASPAVAVERDSRIAAARIFRELDLEGEPLPTPRRRAR